MRSRQKEVCDESQPPQHPEDFRGSRGDKATGVSYCMVTLIAVQNGKRVKTTMGVHYEDEFVRDNGRWLISKRKSVFDWQDRQEIGQ
jgi:hypothetical protein